MRFCGNDYRLRTTDEAGDPGTFRKIVTAAKERKSPANSCSEKELCDFYFPSIVTKDGLVIGLTASGTDHGLVKRTRMELEEYLGK